MKQSESNRPRLLIVELWGLGDLAIATPFVRAASEKFHVTVMAKPYAKDLQERFWPGVDVVVFNAPWTAFQLRDKYRLHQWPWRKMFRLQRELRERQFDVGLSARWDPRDHVLLALIGSKRRLGFSRVQSGVFLTDHLVRPDRLAHRYEYWRAVAQSLGLHLPQSSRAAAGSLVGRGLPRAGATPAATAAANLEVLIHTGAGQPVRVWPLEKYHALVLRLRHAGHQVQVACDPDQREWWRNAGEKQIAAPQTVPELLGLLDRAEAFIGNDSGSGHLAALIGLPTFTIFGPQVPEWFAPFHAKGEWIEGKACPFKPCSDYCRLREPVCLTTLSEAEVWERVRPFLVASFPERVDNRA